MWHKVSRLLVPRRIPNQSLFVFAAQRISWWLLCWWTPGTLERWEDYGRVSQMPVRKACTTGLMGPSWTTPIGLTLNQMRGFWREVAFKPPCNPVVWAGCSGRMWTVTAHFILPVQNLQVSICPRSIKAKAFHNFLYISMGLSARTRLYNFRNYH